MIRCHFIAVALTAFFLAGPACAAPVRSAPMQMYGGLAYQAVNVSGGSAGAGLPTDMKDGINGHVGVRMGRNLGFELGYSSSDASRSTLSSTSNYASNFKLYGPTLDAMYYLPVFGPKFSIIGTGGVSYLTGSARNFNPASPLSYSKSEFGYRGGAGLQWRPVSAFSVDGIARYQSADFNGLAKGGLSLSLGLNFYL